MATSITLQAAVTHVELLIESGAQPCISLELSMVQEASDIVSASGVPVEEHRFNLRVTGGEPLLGNGEPVPSGGVGILSYIPPYESRWADVGSAPASVAGWATVSHDRFDALWLAAVFAAPFLVATSIQVGPFSNQNPETWIWDSVANEHLVISRVELRFSRQP